MASQQTLLQQQRDKVAAMRTDLAHEEAILTGMERMAAAQPTTAKAKPAREKSTVGGRQVGAISHRWRRVLGTLGNLYGHGFSTMQVIQAVKQFEGREMRPSEVKRLFQTYVDQGTLEVPFDDHWRVADAAWDRLNLNEAAEKPEDGSNGNEDAGDEAGPSDVSGPDARTSEPLNLDNPYRLRAVEGG
jgi:hypothetical protein